MGCLPLGPRDLRLPKPQKAILAGAIMLGSIALGDIRRAARRRGFRAGCAGLDGAAHRAAARGLHGIDWPVVVLLAALIPVAGAMESTGAAALLANFLIGTVAQGNAVVALALVLVTTMFLSDVMNNAATAAVMCPIALGYRHALGVNADSLLMAVAIGASCAFLTPIGHQNNTLILGPGGFGFGDYWRLGLPLEALDRRAERGASAGRLATLKRTARNMVSDFAQKTCDHASAGVNAQTRRALRAPRVPKQPGNPQARLVDQGDKGAKRGFQRGHHTASAGAPSKGR